MCKKIGTGFMLKGLIKALCYEVEIVIRLIDKSYIFQILEYVCHLSMHVWVG